MPRLLDDEAKAILERLTPTEKDELLKSILFDVFGTVEPGDSRELTLAIDPDRSPDGLDVKHMIDTLRRACWPGHIKGNP